MSEALVFFAGMVLAFTAGARRLGRLSVTAPMAFALIGAAAGLFNAASLHSEGVVVLVEATLVLLLFHDAAQVRPREIGSDGQFVARLLLLGFPLTIALGYGAAQVLAPELAWPYALLLAAALAPTDAGLGAATVLNPVVPVRIRRLLNVESGLNDGLATPVVLFAIASVVGSGAGVSRETTSVAGAIAEIAIGVAVGVLVGGLAGVVLTASRRRDWSTAGGRSLGLIVLPAGAYAAAALLHGNGFVAAFVTGTALAASARWITDEKSALELTGSVADLLGFAVWFLLGVAFANVVGDLRWSSLAYALTALTVVRMLPVWVSLLGSRLRLRTVVFMGWFGPRGLASVVFVLLAVEAIPESPTLDAVMATVLLTVALSVVLHGASADVLASRYGAWVRAARPEVELQSSVEPHHRSGASGPHAAAAPQQPTAG